MKTIAIYQPYFFPYIGYWQLLEAVDVFVVGDDLQYMMRSFINRNTILLNHERHRFSISVAGASPQRTIGEIEIADDFHKFRKMLQHAYGRSAHFAESMRIIDEILDFEDRNLARFLGNQINVIARHLGLRAKVVYLSELNLGHSFAGKEQRLVDCAKVLGADRIVNPIGSVELYAPEDFSPFGVDVGFLRTHAITYPQANREFVPNLSLIDAMMCNSKEALAGMMTRYDIVDSLGSARWNTQ